MQQIVPASLRRQTSVQKEEENKKANAGGNGLKMLNGRDDWIRTSDPLTPSQVRYRAALRPDPLPKKPDLHTGLPTASQVKTGEITSSAVKWRPTGIHQKFLFAGEGTKQLEQAIFLLRIKAIAFGKFSDIPYFSQSRCFGEMLIDVRCHDFPHLNLTQQRYSARLVPMIYPNG